MSIAAFSPRASMMLDSPVEAPSPAGASIGLAVHDSTRIEWTVAIEAMPRGVERFTLEVELEIPANVAAPHTPWSQLQAFARLDSQSGDTPSEDADIDSLRRCAASIGARLAWSSQGFARHCERAKTLRPDEPLPADLGPTLLLWINVGLKRAQAVRDRLTVYRPEEEDDIRTERRLADEFVSMQVLAMLTGAAAALTETMRSTSRPDLATALTPVEERIVEAIEAESTYRLERGFVPADAGEAQALERYQERASRLKKHFQEVLFLEARSFQVTERVDNWVAVVVALVASTWAFVWQVALAKRMASASSRVGSGLLLLAVIAGLVYAAKDRIKEIGRKTIARSIGTRYAQRVTRFRAPTRGAAGGPLVMTARESFEQHTVMRPDPLNVASGASMPRTVVRFVQKGSVRPLAVIPALGPQRIMQVFRYDFSPLFPRLHDPVKTLAVVDRETHTLRFTEAPRAYRADVRVRLTYRGRVQEQVASLVLNKKGIVRLERPTTDAPE